MRVPSQPATLLVLVLHSMLLVLYCNAGRAAWEAVVRVYASQLAARGEPHLAALYLISLGDAAAAVGVYRGAGLLREAVQLASARMLPEDPELLVRGTAS